MPRTVRDEPHSIEHVQPRAKGGVDDTSNLALACQGCNNHKYVKTHATDELTDEAVPLFNPRTMRWEEHFAWSADFSEIIPLSPVGRATVRELQLNRTGACNLRRVLYAMGEHPAKR